MTTVEIDFTIADSPLGRLLLAATTRGVCRVMIGDSDRTLEKDLREEYPHAVVRRNDRILAAQVRSLLEHLRGKSPHVELPTRRAGDGLSMAGLAPAAGDSVRRDAHVSRSGCRDRQADGDPRRCPRLRDQSGRAADSLPSRHSHRRFDGRISVGDPDEKRSCSSRSATGATGALGASGATGAQPTVD